MWSDPRNNSAAGPPWCERLAEVTGGVVQIAVVGLDRKTLAEHVRRKISEQPGLVRNKLTVKLVQSEAAAVLEYADSVRCRTLLIVHRTSDADFQREIFEQSKVRTIWVHAKGPPPDSPNHVFAMLRRPSLVTTIGSERMLGIDPRNAALRKRGFGRKRVARGGHRSDGSQGSWGR